MRIFLTCLGHNSAEMVQGALENLEETTSDHEHRRLVKTLFLCQYPLPSENENRQALLELGAKFGWWTTEIPNFGVMENHNKAIHDFYRMRPGDFYVCFDPDVRMQQKGWISAMVEALESEREAVFCAAALPFHDEEWCYNGHGRTVSTLPTGLRISRYKALVAWSMGMWKGEWLAARPRDFKAAHPVYGWTEHADLALMEKHGKTWLSTTDYYDHHKGADPIYCEWKIACAQGKTNLKFGDWLKERI